ncbi:Vitrin Precursor [Takifugu flavidus]|uniref:Vitrin n=1 Tax=Takifugu flavidus TaxID=433684 RepID=A0A5C6PGK3_9TELE|nr:Vitrin Precursor [Takifugu flavidus]
MTEQESKAPSACKQRSVCVSQTSSLSERSRLPSAPSLMEQMQDHDEQTCLLTQARCSVTQWDLLKQRRSAMKSAPLAAVCLGLLLSCTCWAKPNGPKGKKPKQVIPAIECDVRAGKINLPEFIAKCPAHCKETKQQVYGSGVFASISSICNAAIHSGVITNAGGKVIVKKMAGQNIYKGSSSNGVRSLSLPKWRESFVVTVGKPKKGVIYPATLDYVPSRPTYVKTSQKEAKSPPVTTELPTAAAPEPTTTTTPQPSSTSSTTLAPSTPPPTTPPPSTPPPATTKARAAVHKVRDAGNGHPYLASEPSASSRQQPHNGPGGSGPGQRRPEPGATIRRQPSSPAGPGQPP